MARKLREDGGRILVGIYTTPNVHRALVQLSRDEQTSLSSAGLRLLAQGLGCSVGDEPAKEPSQ